MITIVLTSSDFPCTHSTLYKSSTKTVQPSKRNVLASLFALLNRPMLALSVLIHVGLLSIPLPDPTPSAKKSPEAVSGIQDFAEVNLATSPATSPLPIPLTVPSPLAPKGGPGVKVDLSRPPRPPQKATPTPKTIKSQTIATKPATPSPRRTNPAPSPPSSPSSPASSSSPPTPKPTQAPQGQVLRTPSPSPSPNPSPLPVLTPPPPASLEDTATTEGLTIEGVQSVLNQFRGTRSGEGNGEMYPAELDQPNAFFKPQVVDNPVGTEEDCLPLMIDCWWEREQNPDGVKQTLEQAELFQNIAFEEIPGGYGGGKLYRLLQKSTGEPTRWYLTLVKPKGIMTKGTMVGFWHTDPRVFASSL